MNRIKSLCLGLMFVFCAMIYSGCATPVYRMHNGEDGDQSKTAVLEPGEGMIPLLCKVDGKPGPKRFHVGFGKYLPRYNSMNGGRFKVELAPGEHILECSVMNGGWASNTTFVKFNAQAGRKYQLVIRTKSQGGLKTRQWGAEVIEAM